MDTIETGVKDSRDIWSGRDEFGNICIRTVNTGDPGNPHEEIGIYNDKCAVYFERKDLSIIIEKLEYIKAIKMGLKTHG